MSSEPKKVDRRSFIYAGLGAVALIAIGAAAYVALNPPVVTQTITTSTTVPTTSIVTTTVPTTSVVTTTVPTTTVVTTTPTTTPIGGKLTIIFEKGWYVQEDEAKKWLATMFKRETGVDVELNIFAEEDAHKKVVAGCQAGNPPDLGFVRMWDWIGQELAWNGWLEDVSDICAEAKSQGLIEEWTFNAAYLWNYQEKKRAYYFVPFAIDTAHISYWRTYLQTAGVSDKPEDIPLKLDEFYAFWKQAQDKLWQKDPSTKDKVYGVGWPSLGGIGVNPGDGWAQMGHIMAWYGWDPITPTGTKVDTVENVNAFKNAVKIVTDTYLEGYSPPGMLDWASPDNNKAFNSVPPGIISVFNASMSIPLYHYSVDPNNYFDKTASLPNMPSPDGKPGINLWHTFGWYMFKDAKNKKAARAFIKWFLQPEILNEYMKAAGGRMFPASMEIIESDPYWIEGKKDTGRKDPHLPTVYSRLKYGKNKPFFHQQVGHPGFRIIDAYALAACHRVISDKWSVDDAVKEAVQKWQAAINEYESKVKG
ncbi:MAG: extracellular solute-binding protein [Nitrososphaeria archaeon]